MKQISEQDVELMRNWISQHISGTPASHDLLLREYYAEKVNLFKLLGEEFDICKEIKYEKNEQELASDFNNILDNDVDKQRIYDSIYCNFSKIFRTIREVDNVDLRTLLSLTNLFKNRVPETLDGVKISDPKTDKTFTISYGMKIIKVLEKIAKAYDIENFEDFRILHSQVLNQKIFSGKLHLSIHPIEFMTLSDNNCNWSSCMSWSDEGGYRRGTLEMMNSSSVLIGYLEAEKPFYLYEKQPWHNKRWRSLFIYDTNFIASIIGYPYNNDILAKICIEWIAELAEKNLGERHSGTVENYDAMKSKLRFETDAMYNDMNNTSKNHYIMIENPYAERFYFNYSGTPVCLYCGCTYPEDFGEECYLGCRDCEPDEEQFECEFCGNYEHEDCGYWVDDCHICSHCYETHTRYCEICEEDHMEDHFNCVPVRNAAGEETCTVYICDHCVNNANIIKDGPEGIYIDEKDWREN